MYHGICFPESAGILLLEWAHRKCYWSCRHHGIYSGESVRILLLFWVIENSSSDVDKLLGKILGVLTHGPSSLLYLYELIMKFL